MCEPTNARVPALDRPNRHNCPLSLLIFLSYCMVSEAEVPFLTIESKSALIHLTSCGSGRNFVTVIEIVFANAYPPALFDHPPIQKFVEKVCGQAPTPSPLVTMTLKALNHGWTFLTKPLWIALEIFSQHPWTTTYLMTRLRLRHTI